MIETPRNTTTPAPQPRHQPSIRRSVERLMSYPGSTNSPSETAIRSIHEKRSTPRW